jgi:hypothetical protein
VRKQCRHFPSATLLLALTIMMGVVALGPIGVKATSFSTAQQVPTATNNLPIWPSAARDASGKIWLAYANKTVGSAVGPDIFFKTWNGITWSNPQRVTNDPSDDDINPFVTPLSNGTMMIVWSSNRTGCNGCNKYQLFYKLYSSATSKPTTLSIRLTNSSLNDTQPSAVQDRNGRIWVSWTRENQTTKPGGIVFYGDIYYKYFNGTSWSPDFGLPQASNVVVNGKHQTEFGTSMIQTKDGRVWIGWASNETADGTFDLFYKTTDGTLYALPAAGIGSTSWSPRVNLCCSDTGADDDHPALVQARNGTIILFWERCVGSTCLNNIFFRTSLDNGATWTAATAVPAASTTADERFPAAAQMGDQKVWVFWQTTALISTQLWYTMSDPIVNVHDIGISALVVSPRLMRSGIQWDNSGMINVSVTVRNYGDFAENTTLTVRLNNTILTTMPVLNLTINQARLLQFSWQSSLGFWGKYVLTAVVQPVPGENTINQGDNSWSGGPVRVSAPGDVDFNGCVNIFDAALLAYSYGATRGPPPSPLWNPSADIDHSGVIDILDAAQLAFYFGDCV